MKINYKILWIDDKISVFVKDKHVERIREHLDVKGFDPDIQIASNALDFFEKLDASKNLGAPFDFILTDYNMPDMNGNLVIDEVRKRDVFTEILFYTADSEWKTGDEWDRISFLQTRRYSGGHHDNVIDKAINIIDLTIKKFEHIVTMRGMIMHEVSFLDAQMLDIITKYIEAKSDDAQTVKNRVLDDLISHHKEKLEKSEELKKKNRFDKILSDPVLFSASQRASAIDEIITIVGCENFITDFKNEIIKVRNEFAHAMLEIDPKTGREYFKNKSGGTDFNEEKCVEIRGNILKHKANLDDLEGRI